MRKPNKNKINYDSLTHITCHDCKEELPKASYYTGKWSYCKSCFNKRNVKYAAKNKKPTKKEQLSEKPKINAEFDNLDISFDFNIHDNEIDIYILNTKKKLNYIKKLYYLMN